MARMAASEGPALSGRRNPLWTTFSFLFVFVVVVRMREEKLPTPRSTLSGSCWTLFVRLTLTLFVARIVADFDTPSHMFSEARAMIHVKALTKNGEYWAAPGGCKNRPTRLSCCNFV